MLEYIESGRPNTIDSGTPLCHDVRLAVHIRCMTLLSKCTVVNCHEIVHSECQ
jgi:hypothetical protein